MGFTVAICGGLLRLSIFEKIISFAVEAHILQCTVCEVEYCAVTATVVLYKYRTVRRSALHFFKVLLDPTKILLLLLLNVLVPYQRT